MSFPNNKIFTCLLLMLLPACKNYDSDLAKSKLDWDHINYAEIVCKGAVNNNPSCKNNDDLADIGKRGKSR